MSWDYKQPFNRNPNEVAKKKYGAALDDLYDANGKIYRRKKAKCSVPLHCCVMTAQLRSSAGFTPAAGPNRVTRLRTGNSDLSGIGRPLAGHGHGR
ncbi:hypothetical protein ACNKHW_10760 [Shigella flexneri]